MTPRLSRLATSLALSLAASASFAASIPSPTLIVDANGYLTGAKGVVLGNTSYDVTFVGGSCANAFGGCAFNTRFTFANEELAATASKALSDRVFVNGPQGRFDSQPWLVKGCESSEGKCDVSTPFSLSTIDGQSFFVDAASFTNWNRESADGQTVTSTTSDATSDTQTWALWQPSVSRVPEPGGMALAAAALGAAFMSRRRGGAR